MGVSTAFGTPIGAALPQPSLFDNELGPFHHNAPDTSRQAAIDNFPRSGTQRARVLVAIARSLDGLTDHEITAITGIIPSSERPRRGELEAAGLIESSGRTRPSPTGSQATVWIATDAGHLHVLALLRSETSA